ncbi:hypothetical protein [Priestia megaterium]|uniref:Uncharacterized protein n=1 Tax=Priestia megaterium TaxID=1404 RepID=A0A6M6E019_PRIMG|nr:hypothetical protein [Priestia megaterium]QJX80451.1 hypothetical protein FDZ14_30655 [Priestia megaterium]
MRENHLVVGIIDGEAVIRLRENSTIEEVKDEQFKYVEETELDLEKNDLTIYVIDPHPEVKQLHEVFDFNWGAMSTGIKILENASKFNRDNSYLVIKLSKREKSIRIYRDTVMEQVINEELSLLDTQSFRTDSDSLMIFKFNSSDKKESVTKVWNYSNELNHIN